MVTRLLFVDKRTPLKALWLSLGSTGLLLVIEIVFSGGYPLGIPWAVFFFLAVMSLLAASSRIEGFNRKPKRKFVALGSILVGLFAIAAWTTLFVDQLPCFFGDKGC